MPETACIHKEKIESPKGKTRLMGICLKCGHVRFYDAVNEDFISFLPPRTDLDDQYVDYSGGVKRG